MAIDHLSDDNQDVAIALGNMVVAWSAAEWTLSAAFSTIANMDMSQADRAYYRIPTFEARIKVMLAMIPDRKPDGTDIKAMQKAIEAISGLAATRNNWVHNSWTVDTDTGGLMVTNSRIRGDGWAKPVKAHDIRHHTETVIRRTRELDDLIPPPLA
jgi:hypothetical protein